MDIEQVKTISTCVVHMSYASRQQTVLKRGHVQLDSTDGETYFLTQGDAVLRGRLHHGGNNERLRMSWQSRCYVLAYLEQDTIEGMDFTIRITPFDEVAGRCDTLPLAISKKVEEASRKLGGPKNLARHLTLKLGNDDYVLIQPFHRKNVSANASQDEDEDSVPTEGLPGVSRFCLVCSLFTLRVCRREEHGTEYYEAYRLDPNRGIMPQGCIKLIKTHLRIGNHSNAISLAQRMFIDSMGARNASYLDLWKKYRDALMDAVLEKGRKYCLNIQAAASDAQDSIELLVTGNNIEAIEKGDDVCLVSTLPPYLDMQDSTESQEEIRKKVYENTQEAVVLRGTVGAIKPGQTPNAPATIELRTDSLLTSRHNPTELTLIPDINSDVVQLQRQHAAYEAIYQGYSANNFLAQVIEKGSPYSARPRKEKIPAESPFVKAKLFSSRELTPNQMEAIEIALNTPDIVLIQGPPGTGKTTVITAILERLNELHDKRSPVQGEVLVTSFQHDAVENIIERLSINSLPTIKFGTRNTDNNDLHSETRTDQLVRNWAGEVADRLIANYPELSKEQPEDTFRKTAQTYASQPLPKMAQQVLMAILAMPLAPSEALQARIRETLQKLQAELPTKVYEEVLPAVYALRVSNAGYADDGFQTVKMLLSVLDRVETAEDILDQSALDIRSGLQEICDAGRHLPEPLFKKLKSIKQELLRLFTPQTSFSLPKPRADILDIIDEYNREYESDRSAAELSETSVRRQFLNTLQCNPEGITEAIESYGYVYAASNQQALGRAIMRRKAKAANVESNRDFLKRADKTSGIIPEMFYSTVVVDEAAKSAPPDLMIPMALAKHRIILVGDHRQLPHMVDEEICKQMESDTGKANTFTADSLKDSMFEYLKERLEDLQKKDGIKRTITLNNQYRTHPLLGNLVSRYFYDRYGEGYNSPLPAEKFAHHLPDTGNSPCVWINVSGDTAVVERKNQSLINRREAQQLVAQLKKWLDSPEGENLSFGVISFYKAQLEEIHRAMAECGIADTRKAILPKYRTLKTADGTQRERLRIGTVDSFQGMEFDVVILSMVRKKVGQSKAFPFGFLECANRLCVALSRQKRMLAIAGDPALVDNETCRSRLETVAILSEFYDKCKEYNSIIQS